MKIEVAKKYSEDIRNKVYELNELISNAAQEGVYVDLEIFEINMFGLRHYPTIRSEVKIDPTSLDD